jgi:tRNA dimethylallyltransferase
LKHASLPKQTLLVIAGPTGSGKTQLAVALAESLNAEIVGADSQQVYRHFDIGTAKPCAQLLSRVPHHLVSCLKPMEECTAARYAALADEAIADIHSRGKQVVVVGGTGLYLRALLHGLAALPPADLSLRSRLEAWVKEAGEEALHQRLKEVDAEAAARLPKGDVFRRVRALEIFEQTGRPASEQWEEHRFKEERYAHCYFVLSLERARLYEAINQRAEQMFEGGLLAEAEHLLKMGFRGAPAMRSVGYREALEVLDGKLSEAKARLLVAQNTRHYAKRQLTWFRKEEKAQWVSAEELLRCSSAFSDAWRAS